MKIKTITGMFKMEDGDISVREDRLAVSTASGERSIPLSAIESISVIHHMGRNTRFEISLNGESIEGFFLSKSDAGDFADSLKESMASVLQVSFRGQ